MTKRRGIALYSINKNGSYTRITAIADNKNTKEVRAVIKTLENLVLDLLDLNPRLEGVDKVEDRIVNIQIPISYKIDEGDKLNKRFRVDELDYDNRQYGDE